MPIEEVEATRDGEAQREMAVSLVHEMGYDAAVAVCCEHGWRGALQQLMQMRPPEGNGGKAADPLRR
ncbi:MAG: hypothetical protein QNJ84_08585 [Alphaproteobacteria bacterium]|nr:hypothetical protein [Alphaproteobacteria bacterium]